MDVIGYIGGFLLCTNLVPQLYHSVTTNSSKDISILFLLLNQSGLTLYTIYGFAESVYVLAFPAFVSVVLNTLLMLLKWKHSTQTVEDVAPTNANPSIITEMS